MSFIMAHNLGWEETDRPRSVFLKRDSERVAKEVSCHTNAKVYFVHCRLGTGIKSGYYCSIRETWTL
jgi:hypothetical protein